MQKEWAVIAKNITTTLLISVLLIGCGDKTNEDEQPIESISQGDLHIVTDLDIASLKPVSDAFTQETGINIEWISVKDSDLISDDFYIQQDKKMLHNDKISNATQSSQQDNIGQDKSNQIDKVIVNQSDSDNAQNSFIHANSKLPDNIDMLLMRSAYTLNAVSLEDKLQPIGSELLIDSIPQRYQDEKGQWYGLTKYARTIVFDKNKVNEAELINYAGLAADKWFGRLCMTSLNKPENEAILKVMLPYRGNKNTPKVIAGWSINMGEPLVNDSEVLSQIEQGHCDVGIVDSDVFWRYAKSNPNTQIRLMWANQINRGVITNTLTAGLTKSGDGVGHGLRFMEWLVSDKGQALLAFHTSTFPVVTIHDDTVDNEVIRPEWTNFDEDPTSLKVIMEDKNLNFLLATLEADTKASSNNDNAKTDELSRQ